MKGIMNSSLGRLIVFFSLAITYDVPISLSLITLFDAKNDYLFILFIIIVSSVICFISSGYTIDLIDDKYHSKRDYIPFKEALRKESR